VVKHEKIPVAKKQKIETEEPQYDPKYDPKLKPKAGFEHRYRISRMLAEQSKPGYKKVVQQSIVKKEKKVIEEQYDPKYDPKLKPKVGFEHRYRIGRMLAEQTEPGYKKAVKNEKLSVAKKQKKADAEDDPKYDPKLKPRVGFEFRYRVGRMLHEQSRPGYKPKKMHETKVEETAAQPEEIQLESKPKVSFEHRYRVNKMLVEQSQPGYKKAIEPVIEKKLKEKIEEYDPKYDPKLKPKSGFEHRYRINKMLADNVFNKAMKKKKKSQKQLVPEPETPTLPKKEEEIDLNKPKSGFEHRYRINKLAETLEMEAIKPTLAITKKEPAQKPRLKKQINVKDEEAQVHKIAKKNVPPPPPSVKIEVTKDPQVVFTVEYKKLNKNKNLIKKRLPKFQIQIQIQIRHSIEHPSEKIAPKRSSQSKRARSKKI
jgi:6-pyruvoyl-tetrahydropterin synthase